MLYVAICNAKAGSTTKDRMARRVAFHFPPDNRIVAEYWLMSEQPNVILIIEGDSIAALMASIAAWDDVYDITIVPAMTADAGIALAQQALAGAAR